jgi:PHD/YefM family antitoxin component YafN of YafNO toxin-antitoxin module
MILFSHLGEGRDMTTAHLTGARERLSEIIDDVVTRGSQWTITRHGLRWRWC